MTVTTTTLTTTPTTRIREFLRRVAAAAHGRGAAIAARWRAEVAGDYFGPDAEAIMGRGTGARV
jgi:hypothetical protein